MKIYYRGNPIKEVSSKEEAKTFIEEIRKEKLDYYNPLIKESKNLIRESASLRDKNLGESSEKYLLFLKENNKAFFERLEILGKSFYKDDYIDIYFYHPDKDFFGFIVKHNDKERRECIANFGLNACTKLAFPDLFEIKD